jgi:Zn-dependent protease with chaperone function
MPMTNAEFDALVTRLERQAGRSPTAYKLKLGAFAALGYAYVFGVLLVLVGIAVWSAIVIVVGKGGGLIQLVIPLFVLIGVVLESLWVRLEAPRGLRVSRSDYPELFRIIDEIRKATAAPPAHEVLLTNELNAAIVQVPRLGLFGWQKNYMILGLPLLQMLSLDELKAVLAHERGHLSGAHGRFGSWIYRIRAGWARLADTLQRQEHWGRFMFVPFFNWYAPTFAAYSFVQARRQEYEADRAAAEAYGAAPLGHALVRLNLKGQELDNHYWPSIFKAADDSPTPAAAPYRGLMSAERRGFVAEAPEQLRQALELKTSTADTHPCLRDRLAALGRPPCVPPVLGASAAEHLFGASLGALVARFDAEWQTAVAEWWRGRYEHVKNGRAKLTAAATRPRAELNDVELYEYASLLEELDDAAKAFDIYRELVVERGARRGAKFSFARMLLLRNDESGIGLFEELMRDMPEATLPACDLIVGYLRSRGRQAEAQPYIDRYIARHEQEQRARAERETVRVKDKFLPHTLSADALASLKEALARHRRQIKLAYLVRKQVPEGEPPLHVVGVLRRSSLFKLESSEANRRLVNELAGEVRVAEVIFIWLNGEQRTFKKPFKRVAGSRIAF